MIGSFIVALRFTQYLALAYFRPTVALHLRIIQILPSMN